MKNRILALAAFLAVTIFSTSCIFMGPSLKGNGKVVEEKRKAGKFDELKVSRGMNVYVRQGENPGILVKADENLLDHIITEVDNRTLKITTDANIKKATTKKVFITVRDLKVVKASAGSNVYSEGILEFDNVEIGSSAGSNLKLELKSNALNASASAGSNIMLEGEATNFTGNASSGSNLKAGDLKTENAEVKTSSGANIWISVKNDLQASSSSGGNIFYYGSPKNLNSKSSSGGNIIKK